jgi:hypothetical protein
MNGYLIYRSQEIHRLNKEFNLTYGEAAERAGQKWHETMSQKEKDYFIVLVEQDQVRYNKEKAAYDFEEQKIFSELIQWLVIECKANINAVDNYGQTPFHLVIRDLCVRNRSYVLKTLLKLKSSTTFITGNNVNVSPFITRQSHWYKDAAWYLMEHGVVFSGETNVYKWGFEMQIGRQRARKAALIVMGIRRKLRSPFLNMYGIDVSRLVAQAIWESRGNYQVWAEDSLEKSVKKI